MGYIYLIGLDANDKVIWVVGNGDGWAWSGGSMIYYFYDINGNYMSTYSFRSGGGTLPNQGSFHITMVYNPATYTYTLSTTGAYTKSHSFSYSAPRETTKLRIQFSLHLAITALPAIGEWTTLWRAMEQDR